MNKNETADRWTETEEYLSKLENKYCDLVWYARSDKKYLLDNEMYEVLSTSSKIEDLYKDEISNLLSDESDWHHGFNSGMLAGIRLIRGLMSKELIEVNDDDADVEYDIIIDDTKYVEYDGWDDSISDFPFLDT